MNFGRIRALIKKELLAILRDPKSRTVLFVPPLIQLVVFSFAATLEVKNVSLAVLNRDGGRWSYELVQRFAASPTFTRVIYVRSPEGLRQTIDRQEAILALSVPPDFSREVAAGRRAQVQLILDGRRSNAAQIVLGYATTIIERLNQEIATTGLGLEPPATVIPRNWFNPNLQFTWYTVPSLMGTLLMVTGIIITSLSVARERELATFEQLLVSPLTVPEILIGKSAPALLVGLAQATLLLTVALLGFRVPFAGSALLLFFSMSVFLAAVIGPGLFISSLCKTQQQAILGAFAFISSAILLSGFATPVENMPPWLQVVTEADPLKHFMIILRGIFLKAMPADQVLTNTWPMAAIALCSLTAAAWLFRARTT
jgi:ABC-2 type transport system permease protein